MFSRGVSKQPDLTKLLTYENDLDSLCFESMASTPSWARESHEPVAVDQAAQEHGKRDVLGPLLDHNENYNHIHSKCKASVEHVAANKKGPTLPSGRKQRAAQESARGALTSTSLAPTFIEKSADCAVYDRKKGSKKKVRAGKKPVEVTKGSPGWKENNPGKVAETSSNHACEEEFAQANAELQRGILMCQEKLVKSKNKGLNGNMFAVGPRKGKENESCEDKQNRSVVDCSGVQSMLQSLRLGDNRENEYKTKRTPVCHEYNQEEDLNDTNRCPCDRVGNCTERRHIRFDDDGNILPHSPGDHHQSIESTIIIGSDLALPAKEELGLSKLRGLPTPKGTHVRFS